MNKKIIALSLAVGFLVAGLVMPTGGRVLATVGPIEELRALIQNLLAQIQQLQERLAVMQGQGQGWCYAFDTNLKIGDQNDGVTNLSRALIKEGFLNQDEVFQDGRTVLNFDEMTASAVTGFQEKYRSEILTPNGLKSGTGYVGPSTRKKLNQLYGCGQVYVAPPAPIVSGDSATNHPPKINLTSPIPSLVSIGQTVVLTWTASDPDGDPLKWKRMSQGGEEIGSCNGLTVCTQTFKWFTAGTYVVKMAVFDGNGLAAEYDTQVTVSTVSTQFNVFFFNGKLSPPTGYGSYIYYGPPVPVARSVSYTVAIATAAINELLKGPTAQEKVEGYTTNIPSQAQLLSLRIENGVAYADFNSQTQSGGSSNPQTLLIEKTLLQFPTVDRVVLSIEGQTENIFQP